MFTSVLFVREKINFSHVIKQMALVFEWITTAYINKKKKNSKNLK